MVAATIHDYAQLSRNVQETLLRAFPDSYIELTEGYLGRVHVLLISPQLNGLTEHGKQNTIWEVLKAEMGDESQGVSVVMAYGTDELR
jgi:hypothetical protein